MPASIQPSGTAPNERFAKVAPEPAIERTAVALRERGHEVVVVGTRAEALQVLLDRIPAGSEVFTSTSETLREIGFLSAIAGSGRYALLRDQVTRLKLDPAKDAKEIKRLFAAPEVAVGSVHAITQEGQILVASASGSQIGLYAYSAARMIWVVGGQKIVSDLTEGLQRLEEHSLPKEDVRAHQAYGRPSSLNKILIIRKEGVPGRTLIILVREALGF